MKTNEELCNEAWRLFKDYKELIKKNPNDLEEIIGKLLEKMNDSSKYTDYEKNIIICKFMVLVLGQQVGGTNVSI